MRRRRLVVRGVVQGVGFRPFVAGLARRLALTGHVRNVSDAVDIEVEGPDEALAAFEAALVREAPPLAILDHCEAVDIPACGGSDFRIDESHAAVGRRTSIPPDVATCDACLRELQDPHDRRAGYPFLNCTQCGPRFTIIERLPYDRATTTMAAFAMCAACRAEYEDPRDRRYHAEPTACPVCGPQVWLEHRASAARQDDTDAWHRSDLAGADALAAARRALADGHIVAIKGLGGFHLACAATNDEAVARLRQRKARGDKPFAVMVASLAAAHALCGMDDDEIGQLTSPARPIVLLRARPDGTPRLSVQVAPGQRRLGVMLPYTPLHHLLLQDGPLVMTSGNRADEPIARTNDEARTHLAALADALLLHDRDIHAVCDDSVIRVSRGALLPMRRSRGYAPVPVRLAVEVAPVLAVGGELKATCCVAQGRDAYLSQHIGDMATLETLEAFERAVQHLVELFGVQPRMVAVDPHPGYLSTRWAETWAGTRGLPIVRVQHHRAHLAALLAEHRRPADARVLGVVFDGTGYGDDGAVWGGEFFVGGYAGAARVGHLAVVPLPASDVDVRHGARLALAHLTAAGLAWDDDLPCVQACTAAERDVLRQRVTRGLTTVASSSAGRLFDAAAALIGVCQTSRFEAEAAMALEALADEADDASGAYAFGLEEHAGRLVLAPAPVWRAMVADVRAGVPAAVMAARFHDGLAAAIVATCLRLRQRHDVHVVALTGGSFQNARLLERTAHALTSAGVEVLTHRLVPPNDGGLALGQAVAASLAM